MSPKPVFFDPTGRRGRRLTWLARVAAMAVVAIGTAFVATLAISHSPSSASAMTSGSAADQNRVSRGALLTSADKMAAELRDQERKLKRVLYPQFLAADASGRNAATMPKTQGRPLTIGFYVNWDDASYPALRRTLSQLDWLVPAWLSLTGPEMSLKSGVDVDALALVNSQRPGLPVLPLIQNAVDDNWDGAGLATLLANPAARRQRLNEILDFITSHKFQGLTVDFEEVPRSAQADLKQFLREMTAAFKPLGLTVALAVPFDDDNWDYKSFAAIADYLILMAYDQHWAQGTPGSIAAQDWYENTLDRRMRDLDPAHTIVAIGAYGYDWVPGQTATDLTFQDAMQAARDLEADVQFDPDTDNPHFSYVEDDGKTHNVWFLDAVTAYNQIHAADVYTPAGYAIWRLGSEDLSLWSVLGRPYGAAAPEGLKLVAAGGGVDVNGQGEILHVVSSPATGKRDLDVDAQTGDIDDEEYLDLPSSYVVQADGSSTNKVALTFDDGPDPAWTPQILDVLKQKAAPATFFIVGENAAANPDIIRRMVDEGFEVGNHTYTHPNIALLPTAVAKLEINATQRLFEAITGRSMTLFRPPYLGDSQPTTEAEVAPIELAQSMGYRTVGLKVDPDDWQRPPADVIVSRVISGVTDPNPDVRGNVVLLHDAGGDRSQTLAALPNLIDALRAKGFELVTVSDLVGLQRDQVMPPVRSRPLGSRWIDMPVFTGLGAAQAMLGVLFTTAIWLGIARLIFLTGLAVMNVVQDRKREKPLPVNHPTVSVLIPARNEERVIVDSVRRVLASLYPRLDVIVIDDGSTDRTSELVRAAFERNEAVTLLTVPNGGKARALNRGLATARGEIVVALDADTQFEKATIARLARWFEDDNIGAVAGNAKVGNRANLVTRWQALEYVTAQNLERRALAALGAITVVPGAVGAWRKRVLDQLGGFHADTLAEDQDLTIAVQRAGFKVLFDSEAVAWTEAPSTFGGLARQRFRWSFGTLQCLWKHRRAMLNRRSGALGMVAFPQVAIFQVLLSLLSPFVDLAFAWQLLWTGLDYLQHQDQFTPDSLIRTGLFFALFMVVDAGAAVLAFSLEKTEDWRLLLWLPLQRFGYRQIMYYVVVKSVLKALTGPMVGWGTIDRTASVRLSEGS